MQRETLAPQRAVERLDEGIVDRLVRPAELERDVMPVGPVVQHLRGEFGAMVDRDALWEPALVPAAVSTRATSQPEKAAAPTSATHSRA